MNIKFMGIIIILDSIVFAIWWVTTQGTYKGVVVTLTLIAVFAGLALVIQERITELTIKGVGTIKAAAEQAKIDAGLITNLKQRIENQSATIDLVAQQASKAKLLSEEAASKNILAEQKLGILDESIDLVAQQASKAKELSEEVADKNMRAEQKLGIIDDSIVKASESLDKLEAATEFTITFIAAQNDDRKAFDKLELWSKEREYQFSKMASDAWNAILNDHNQPFMSSGFHIPWKEGFDPSKLSLEQLAQQYNQSPAYLKPAMLEYIWGRSDISILERLDFMMDVMNTDPSLLAVEYAGRYFTRETKQQVKALAVGHLSKWWKDHRQEYVSK